MTPVHRPTTPYLVFLVTILIAVQYLPVTHSSWINAADFAEALVTLKDDQGLSVLSWQEYLDSLKYDEDLPTGKNMVSSFAAKLARRFDKQVGAIKKLKQTIEANYGSFSTSPSRRCCEKSGLAYDTSFLKEVDKSTECELTPEYGASSGSPRINQAVVDAMKTNLRENPEMKWQYFGSKDGVMTMYPANENCNDFDPRYRPWYVEASTPIAKEVVLVIDSSKSMENPASAPLMDTAKSASVTVLDSMKPHDLVGVVGFNDQISTLPGCFSETMTMASPHNLMRLKEFVKGLKPSGSTSYMKSLQKAFALLQSNLTTSAGEHGSRAKVILFITDGVPDEMPDAIKTEITKLQALQTTPVIIMTYGLGTDLSSSAITILKDISNITSGKFERISSPRSDLRRSLASYYEIFNTKTKPADEALMSVPYYDAFGLGMVTTVTFPVTYNSAMVGVLGIDIPLNDLFSDLNFHRHYIFIIDLTGRAWKHPLLPDAREGTMVSTNINVEALERNAEAASVIESMKQSGTGNKKFVSHHLIPMGDPFRDGVVEQNLNSSYFWNPVQGYNLSICLAMVDPSSTDAEKEVADSSVRNDIAEFVYHRSDIVEPPNACNHFQRVSTMWAAIKFSPECYLDPGKYLNEIETKESIDAIKRYMMYESDRNPGFLVDIRATAAMTSKADDLWVKKLSKIQKYIIWRYIGTYNGIVRFVPLAKIDQAYNPTLRSWYRRALSQPGKSVFSTPYLDAFGAGFVVTLSHTLYLGRKESHKQGDTVIGVLGADFTLEYFYKLIGDTFPKCRESDFSCYVLDNSGYVIIHQDFVEAENANSLPEMEYMHVTFKDSVLAESLIKDKYMTPRGCIDVRQMRDQVCWKLDLGSRTSREFKSMYEISAVGNSNIFIVIKKNATAGKSCPCSKKSIDSVDTYQCGALDSCQCPCYRNTTYSACEDKLDINSTSFRTCTRAAPSLKVTPTSKEEKEKARNLKYCYQEICDQKKSKSECTGLLGCSWCRRDRNGDVLAKPYCGSQDKCYLGVEGLNPYNTSYIVPPVPPLSRGAIAGIVVGVLLGVILAAVIIMFILQKRGAITINMQCCEGPKHSAPMRMTNAESQSSGMNGNSPYAPSVVNKHFDPVVSDGEYM